MSKTLLLADDSVTIQKVVGISFANEDVRIVTVDNGDDAVARAREIRPDIVLADVVMPGKSGYDVCAAIKGDPELRGVPVLLLTGTFETFDEDRAARVGADGHITKPFEAQALVELVNARLAGASAAVRGAKPAAGTGARAAAPGGTKPTVGSRAPEPEPFDFLEPEETTRPRGAAGSGEPVARPSAPEAFAFEAEPLDAGELETGDDEDPFGLGNEATEARTTLLLEDDPLEDAETAPPSGFSARDFESEELTRLVLPESEGEPAEPSARASAAGAAAPDALGDPLDGVFDPVLDDELAAPPRASRDFDVAPELDDPYRTRVLEDVDDVDDAPRDARPAAGFPEPLFDDEPAGLDPVDAPFSPGPGTGSEGAPRPAEAAAAGAPAAPLSEEVRGAMHETLEKIAWEAFGDVSERIVREAVARIEQVAWDVIPRLAETLIREEIRKLKGES